MSTVRVRRLDGDHDLTFGNGQRDYLVDIDAVVQMVQTALLFLQGEWWEDKKSGVPMFQTVLGRGATPKQRRAINGALQRCILAVPHVTGISQLVSNYEPQTRAFTFKATVETVFGPITVSNG